MSDCDKLLEQRREEFAIDRDADTPISEKSTLIRERGAPRRHQSTLNY